MNIQWYPGHMAKTKRLIKENLSLVDIVIEILDARAPISSRNPDIDEMIEHKARLVVLNKADLSDPIINKQWKNFFNTHYSNGILINSMMGQGIDEIIKKIEKMMKDKLEYLAHRGRKNKPIRCMIIGIPNVGKSTFINRIVGKTSVKTGNKPGITKGKQWIRINEKIELLDTPGILWPKFDDQNIGLRLGWIGSIKDEILDQEQLAFHLLTFLTQNYGDLIKRRYKINNLSKGTLEIFNEIALKRGFIIKGGELDYQRTAEMILDEFRKGKIGKISLERPDKT
ncbi:ribosome biogenesis GTPase YlqF [Garciella nitratireducens]|uniref:Ribosome biogenesis GTPase A n=1 Tax=Garciella nitratireducens DSM 15102 TaxID=1121911 RepID=A0A1T4JY06_9FIRM|nr:ribosome biogenesis GTPase YlqF [Garciella nitratireducens]RBP41145.1 ribosome biogenesis GTPase A [Garciella nitratireducens]SJZ34895.1 ribosome biogenesis GTPase A [Garciella nitratireducens DSM 15102]